MSEHKHAHTNRTGKASFTTPLCALRAECAAISRRLGRGRRRRISRSLYAVLRLFKGEPGEAAELAQTVAGVKPSDWLTAREAHGELRRMGILRGCHFLWRLGRKVAAFNKPAEIWLDARGHWDGPGQVRNAVAVLLVKGGSTPRFRFAPPTASITKPANP